MRILHVGKFYPPARGGMETVLRHMCEGLRERGHDVTALVAATAGGGRERRVSPTPAAAAAGAGAAPNGRLLQAGTLAVLYGQPIAPALPLLLRRELRQRPPDILQLHLPNPLASLSCLALLPRRRVGGGPRLAVWHHADIARQRLGARLLAPLLRAGLSRADGIAVSSAALRDCSPSLRPVRDRVEVIPFGIPTAEWSACRGAGEGPFVFVGRLVYYKGLELLLEALACVREAQLLVIGGGPLLGALERRTARLGLDGRVRFAGELGSDSLRRCFDGARALVLPSCHPSETFGVVQLEAMAAGLPVIATRLETGVDRVGRDGETGLTVPPGDAEALAGALRAVMADPARARAWGEAGRRHVRLRYERARMVDGLEAWYARLATGEP